MAVESRAGRCALSRRALLVPVFLGGQALLVRVAAGTEHVPPKPDLARLPLKIGNWEKLNEDVISTEVQEQLHADSLLSWNYVQNGTALFGNVFVAWFQSLRGGASQPHSPQVCLPGSGWVAQSTATIPLETAAGSIEVNRYIVTLGAQKATVIYWYQTPRRVIAGEWAAKFWVMPDALRDKRTDTSLVRVVVFNGGRTDAEASAAAEGLARQYYPLLREILPRLENRSASPEASSAKTGA